MAVIFAVVGGGAVLGIATSPDYGDYGDHSDHSDYSNYSDEAERRQRRIEDKKREINSKNLMLIHIKLKVSIVICNHLHLEKKVELQ